MGVIVVSLLFLAIGSALLGIGRAIFAAKPKAPPPKPDMVLVERKELERLQSRSPILGFWTLSLLHDKDRRR